MKLRYGMNPHQRPATLTTVDPAHQPFRFVHGEPSYINVLDAVAGWQLIREAATALGRPAAASVKHVSPAGAATSGPLDAVTAATYQLDPAGTGPLTSAYVRARDADPKSSYGDFLAVSEPVDAELADLLRRVVADGVVAPGFEEGVVATLSAKKNGGFLVVEADPGVRPPPVEVREVYGLRLTQPRDEAPLTRDLFAGSEDLLLGSITARYTQSNSVVYVRDGMTLGIGAGQQSRIDCTRIAGDKADTWWLRRHPAVRHDRTATRVQDRIAQQLQAVEALTADERAAWLGSLDGVAFVSDGALPFADNVEVAARHGVRHIAEPGGSLRSAEVADECRKRGITLIRTGVRLFRH
ncbi:5-aminoimidazole-4-carboxamide ribonucleotide transformylase [Actinoplanes ianthinogenes]|uniref:5-aminoimidazole-4-carboxamide ribonucleotide transformylase n=1 Tax=Actinoplanes ianthinogenes TaxID=122358 RepID=A0ABN6C530_9ACTN|nr:5-aminoimidazole-4-carboxamide ribonucleotide transformylase [Actinoplanes ianthinogenes]BCJ39414.1 5-aminoimidazole-4-carboxamide ribonucleotide transformylase [Actinoplanes ianthinogenes]GGR36281.1 5-aminoimidazole-4-carboxamide ribonucleotide transformylase [Actinoplanes ianthinogenes]